MDSSLYFKFILQRHFLLFLIFIPLCSFSQTLPVPKDINPTLLNKYILLEVNKLRKKEKVDPLENSSVLLSAAQDHANYMLRKSKLTHIQRFNKHRKMPKNRVDHYGQQFTLVKENIQVNNLRFGTRPDDKKNPPITSYEKLAEVLVVSWTKSPVHYLNMVNTEHEFTYAAVAVNTEGEIYACQLFGGSIYQTKYEAQVDTLKYKSENPRRCRFCEERTPLGYIVVTPDSTIMFVYQTPLRFPTYSQSRMRLFNPWNDGLAANIVLKSQFPCDNSNFSNGRRGVTGIPLPPVYKKDFHIGIFQTSVNLGKVPSYIKEDFEVNLTIIKNKRTCSEIIYNDIPSSYYVDIPLTFGIETKNMEEKGHLLDTITASLFFSKAHVEPFDTTILGSISDFIELNKGKIVDVSLEGYASIEGSTENNIQLYTNRVKYLKDYLMERGIDEKQVSTRVNENFADFREDIQGTEFSYLTELSNEKIKNALKDQTLEKKLEPILAKHRYVLVKIITKDIIDIKITKELTQQIFSQALKTSNRQFAEKLQKVQYGLICKGEMNLKDLCLVEIPSIKRNKLLLHNHAVIRFLIDTLNDNRYLNLENELNEIKMIDSTFKRVRTSLAILEYYRYLNGNLGLNHKEYFKKLKKLPYVDKTVQARIILNFASITDWELRRKKKKYYNNVKTYISPARLDVEKTFEIASYYSYFSENTYAYNLIRTKIDETQNPANLVYFLKLIHLTNIPISRDKYLGYFKKVLLYSGNEFCNFFNSPNLNFQILNDPEVKEIYCKSCAGILNTETWKSEKAN